MDEVPDFGDDDPDWRELFAIPRAYGVVGELLNAARIKREDGFPVRSKPNLYTKVLRHWGFFKIMTQWEQTRFLEEVILILNRDPRLRDIAIILDPYSGM